MNNAARRDATVGEIVNLMSVDAQKLLDVPTYLHMLWAAPVTIALALFFLWQQLGPASLAGFAIMVLLVPLNGVIGYIIRNLQVTMLNFLVISTS